MGDLPRLLRRDYWCRRGLCRLAQSGSKRGSRPRCNQSQQELIRPVLLVIAHWRYVAIEASEVRILCVGLSAAAALRDNGPISRALRVAQFATDSGFDVFLEAGLRASVVGNPGIAGAEQPATTSIAGAAIPVSTMPPLPAGYIRDHAGNPVLADGIESAKASGRRRPGRPAAADSDSKRGGWPKGKPRKPRTSGSPSPGESVTHHPEQPLLPIPDTAGDTVPSPATAGDSLPAVEPLGAAVSDSPGAAEQSDTAITSAPTATAPPAIASDATVAGKASNGGRRGRKVDSQVDS